MKPRLFLSGLIVWTAATLALRFSGNYLLRPAGYGRTLLLFAAAFPAMALLVRAVCEKLPREQRLASAVSFAFPTLLLDPFTAAFFPVVFPNMDPSVAGTFGGLMLWCCAGALTGVMLKR